MAGVLQSSLFIMCLLQSLHSLPAPERERGPRAKCKNPSGLEGETYGNDNCVKFTCTKAKGKNGIWVDRPDLDLCCHQKGTAYQIGDVIDMIVINCTQVTQVCEAQAGSASIVPHWASSCPPPSPHLDQEIQEILSRLEENGRRVDHVGDNVNVNGENINKILQSLLINSSAGTSSTTSSPNMTRPTNGVIITGGSYQAEKVEVYNPISQSSCALADLPDRRYGHSLCGGLLCGGYGTSEIGRSCLIWDANTQTFTTGPEVLVEWRRDHLCWVAAGGVLLMGGDWSPSSSELVASDGTTSSASFSLQYPAEDSCGVDLGNTYVITGGYKADKKVSVYSTSGWTQDLPDLKEGRLSHSCSRFDNDHGEMVLMVTGGWTEKIDGIFLSDSTEMLLGEVWTEVTSAILPSHTYSSVSLNINNVVFIFGGLLQYTNQEILMFNSTSLAWQYVGSLLERRLAFAMEIIEDITSLCP